jgi:hypothetical protein
MIKTKLVVKTGVNCGMDTSSVMCLLHDMRLWLVASWWGVRFWVSDWVSVGIPSCLDRVLAHHIRGLQDHRETDRSDRFRSSTKMTVTSSTSSVCLSPHTLNRGSSTSFLRGCLSRIIFPGKLKRERRFCTRMVSHQKYHMVLKSGCHKKEQFVTCDNDFGICYKKVVYLWGCKI